jgi:PST family polysaccharide transporter
MKLVKVTVLNGIATTVKIFAALIINKIIAVNVGPQGFAIIGQFQNMISIALNLSGGIVSPGIIKETAENQNDQDKQYKIWRSGFYISIIFSFITSILILLFKNKLIELLNLNSEYELSNIFYILAICIPFGAINTIILSIINGKKEIYIYVVMIVSGSIINLITIGVGVSLLGLYGALVGLAVAQVGCVLAYYFIAQKKKIIQLKKIIGQFDAISTKNLIGYGVMGLTSALCVPITSILIRSEITEKLGETSAGYWQAITKISDIYLMMIIMTLSVYYLPKIAETINKKELKNEIKRVNKLLIPLTIAGSIIIYLLRDQILEILFSKEFLPANKLLMWQLIGDVIKISSWILSYIMVGKYMMRLFICSEIIFSIIYYILIIICINIYGLIGAPIAFIINYILYYIFIKIALEITYFKIN